MSLFSQLRRLYRPDRFMVEDFHTEIVAQVLRNSPALTMAWLRRIGVTTLGQVDHIYVATQETFEKLAWHSTNSRPDIVIRLVARGKTELIFIESKLPSTQGYNQLQRYGEHLEAAKQSKSLEKTSLVFITRDYEAAPDALMADPRFKLARWFEFYQILKAHVNGDGLAKELKLFMEENRMSLGNQFRSTDLVALENFLSAKALMDETLQGEVSREASRILGGIINLKKAPNQLRDEDRYIISSVNWNDFPCLIGYWLPHENPDEPVWVGITIYSNPSSAARKDVIDAFRGCLAKVGSEWSADKLDDESAWSCIYKGKALQTLIGGSDHVRTIKDHLLALLKEVEGFRNTYSNLPWGVSDATSGGDGDDESGGSEATSV